MPPLDDFSNVDNLTSQARTAAAVTPSDSTDLTKVPKALYVTGNGNLVVIPSGQAADTPTFSFPVVSGQVFDFVRVRRVLATGTTATAIAGY